VSAGRAPLARTLAWLAAGLAGLCLAAGFAIVDLYIPAMVALVAAAAWLLLIRARSRPAASPGLVVALLAAAISALLGAPMLLPLLAVVLALSAWDLADFSERVDSASVVTNAPRLEREHLLRLLWVDALGLGLAGVALLARINLSFAAVLALGLVAAVGISQVVGHLRKEGD
jgi:hypothetical protein